MRHSIESLHEAPQALSPIFSGIDTKVKHHLRRVLDAFRTHRVGTHHFAGVSGYGHDDLGRQTFDRVFADV
ncbi:aluminum resistance family protein, partial [Arthrospira sp. PCC 8006]